MRLNLNDDVDSVTIVYNLDDEAKLKGTKMLNLHDEVEPGSGAAGSKAETIGPV